MPDQNGRFRWIVKFAFAALIAGLCALGLTVVAAVALTVTGLLESVPKQLLTVALGACSVLALLLLAMGLVVGYGTVKVFVANEEAVSRSAGRLARIESVLQKLGQSTDRLVQLFTLSDRVKGLVYREQQLQSLRDAFQDALVRQEYGLAETIILAMKGCPEYAGEADRMNEELLRSKEASAQEKLDSAVQRVLAMLEQKDWPRAIHAAQRLLQMYPDNPQVTKLPKQIQLARTRHKREALQAYGEAVRKNDVDRSIELLRILDQYLTPQEAAALEESARGVFRAKLHNLGVQFALCVTDERWADALEVGKQIMEEYPNSRMASEVSEKMDQLRAHAAAQQARS